MKNVVLYLSLFLLLSCNNSGGIVGQWQVQKVSHSIWQKKMTEMMDLFEKEYNEKDKDQKREEARQAFAMDIDQMRREFIGNVYDFRKNGIAYITMNGSTDSVKWSAENNILNLDEPALKGSGEAFQYNYLLQNDSLQLNLVLGSDTMSLGLSRIKG